MLGKVGRRISPVAILSTPNENGRLLRIGIRLHVCWCRRHARGTSDTLCVLCFLRVVQPQPEAMPAEAPPSPWDSVGAAPAPVPTPVVVPQQAPSAQASPWDSMGTRGGAPTPVMPAQADEMKKAAAAKATANSDLF